MFWRYDVIDMKNFRHEEAGALLSGMVALACQIVWSTASHRQRGASRLKVLAFACCPSRAPPLGNSCWFLNGRVERSLVDLIAQDYYGYCTVMRMLVGGLHCLNHIALLHFGLLSKQANKHRT